MKSNKVIIAGSINMDIVASSTRHPKVGETVIGNDLKYFPGGKGANQAVASAKLGGKTIIIGKVGADPFGNQLVKFLKKEKVKTNISVSMTAPTGTALITVSSETSDNTIVVVPGANYLLSRNEIKNASLNKGDVLVSQFEIPTDTIISFFKRGKEKGTINILNPAPAHKISKTLLKLVDILILNETELALVSGVPNLIKFSKKGLQSKDKLNLDLITKAVNVIKRKRQSIIVTLGKKGCVGYLDDQIIEVKGNRVKAVDTTGAGDCFAGAIAAKISNGYSLQDAMKFANIAASICVTREGAGPSMPTLDEIK